MLLKSTKWRIGDGTSVDIYKHCWLASRNLIQPPPDQPSTTVSELIDSMKKGWDITKIKGMFEADIAK